jgi:purine-cytosine permease-like protein
VVSSAPVCRPQAASVASASSFSRSPSCVDRSRLYRPARDRPAQIANNIPNLYSFALTAQTLHPWIQAIPRCFLSILATGISIAIAIPASTSFESSLDTLLVLLAYWLSIYCVIVIEEHLIFRRGRWSNYEPDDYTVRSRLPVGLAAALALCCGIAGAVVGAASVWWVGPLAAKIGLPAFGGDIVRLGYCPLRGVGPEMAHRASNWRAALRP